MHFIGDMYVSEVLRKQVLDPHGDEVGRLADFTISLGELFPRVSGLLVTRKGARYMVPWEDVAIFNKMVISTKLPALIYIDRHMGRTRCSSAKTCSTSR